MLASHDQETRTEGATSKSGLLRSYEYRAGIAVFPWSGGIVDVGAAALDRHDGVAGTSFFRVAPTLGIEQAIVAKRFSLRVGLDETTWTAGASIASRPFKLDVAVLKNLAAERTGDVFGKSNVGGFATLTFEYESLVVARNP